MAEENCKNFEDELKDLFFKISLGTEYSVPEYNDLMYHYTSINNVNSILLNSKERITLWASRYDSLNDYLEGKIVEDCYKEVCEYLLKENSVTQKYIDLILDIKPLRNQAFFYTDVKGIMQVDRQEYDAYITSFSKSNDLLPMWNYYSKGRAQDGINICLFSTDVLNKLRKQHSRRYVYFEVYEVVYERVKQKEMIKELLLDLYKKYCTQTELLIKAIISIKLTDWRFIFKSECFKHEEEVRVITRVSRKDTAGLSTNYRSQNGMLVPYIELNFDRSELLGVTQGPICVNDDQKQQQVEILREMLRENGYSDNVYSSKIPVRF